MKPLISDRLSLLEGKYFRSILFERMPSLHKLLENVAIACCRKSGNVHFYVEAHIPDTISFIEFDIPELSQMDWLIEQGYKEIAIYRKDLLGLTKVYNYPVGFSFSLEKNSNGFQMGIYPKITEYEILAELNQHQSLGLAASFVSMQSDRCIYANEKIIQVSGLPKDEHLKKATNNRAYFPITEDGRHEEYDRYMEALLSGRGSPVDVVYKAIRMKDLVLCEYSVQARLVSFQGEPWRLVKGLTVPRPLV